jgi:hypothetical protein
MDIKQQFGSNQQQQQQRHGSSVSSSASSANNAADAITRLKRDQSCQTMLSFEPNVDLSKIEALKPFFIEFTTSEENESSPKKDKG